MPDTSYMSLNGANIAALLWQTRLANATVHLYKDTFNPTPTSRLADFVAAECNFDGYAAITIPTWNTPVLAGLGWALYSATLTWLWTFISAGTPNQVGGYFLVDSSGQLIWYQIFDPTIAMSGPGMAVIKTPTLLLSAG